MDKIKKNSNSNVIDLCIITTITLVLFILLNLLSFLAIQVRNHYADKLPMQIIYKEKLQEIVKGAYPKLDFNEVIRIYKDIEGMDMELEPFNMFTEKKGYASKYVNISKYGYRLVKNQKSLDTKSKKIFIFGSSPTFGYNVRDEDTIASHLQKRLGESYAIYNFGKAYYYSHQQLSLLIRLVIEKDFLPDFVIFINNHANERGLIGPALDKGFENFTKNKREFIYLRDYLPVIKIFQYFQREYLNINSASKEIETPNFQDDINYFLRTNDLAKMVSDHHKIKFLAIYPPAYGYKYENFNKDPLTRSNSKYTQRDLLLFSTIEKKFKENRMPSYFHNLMYLHNDVKRPYVDTAHYSSDLSDLIAINIKKIILKTAYDK